MPNKISNFLLKKKLFSQELPLNSNSLAHKIVDYI